MSSASCDVCVGCDRPLPTAPDGISSVATVRSAGGGAGLCRRCAVALLDGVGTDESNTSGGALSLDSVLWRLGLVLAEDDGELAGLPPGSSLAGHRPAAGGSGGGAPDSASVPPAVSGEAAAARRDGQGTVPASDIAASATAESADVAAAAKPRSLIAQRIWRAERATDRAVRAVMSDLVRKVEASNRTPSQPPQPQSVKVSVIVPENVGVGSRLTVRLSGASFDFIVPEGWVAGETRRVGIPAAAYAAAQARAAQEEARRRQEAREEERRQRKADDAQRRDMADVRSTVERLCRDVVRAVEREACEAARQRHAAAKAEARRVELAVRWQVRRAEAEARKAEVEARRVAAEERRVAAEERRVASEVGVVLGRLVNALAKPEEQAAARVARQAAKSAAREAGMLARPARVDASPRLPNRTQMAFTRAMPLDGHPPPAFAPQSGFAPLAGFAVPPGYAHLYGGSHFAHEHLVPRPIPHRQLAGHAPPASYLRALAPRGPSHPSALPRVGGVLPDHGPQPPYGQAWPGPSSHPAPAGEAPLPPRSSAAWASHNARPEQPVLMEQTDHLLYAPSWESLEHASSVPGAAAVPPLSHVSQLLARSGEAGLRARMARAPQLSRLVGPPPRVVSPPPRRVSAARARGAAATAGMPAPGHSGRGVAKKGTPRYPRVILKFKGKR